MLKTTPILLVLFAGVPLILMIWLVPALVLFKNFETTEIVRLFTILLLVSLFLERALEVFMTTWRGPTAMLLELKIQGLEKKVSRLEKVKGKGDATKNVFDITITDLERAKKVRAEYKCRTQQIALWVGLGVGLLISTVGIQTFQTLVGQDMLKTLPEAQAVIFRWLDVMLTGGLIAGGSEGVHKMAQVYKNFMNTTAQRAKGGTS